MEELQKQFDEAIKDSNESPETIAHLLQGINIIEDIEKLIT